MSFWSTALGTNPILRQIFECFSLSFIVYIITNHADVLGHYNTPFSIIIYAFNSIKEIINPSQNRTGVYL